MPVLLISLILLIRITTAKKIRLLHLQAWTFSVSHCWDWLCGSCIHPAAYSGLQVQQETWCVFPNVLSRYFCRQWRKLWKWRGKCRIYFTRSGIYSPFVYWRNRGLFTVSVSVCNWRQQMVTIDFNGTIHIQWYWTSKEKNANSNADARCELTLSHFLLLVFRKKDLYLVIIQKLTFMKSGGFHVKPTRFHADFRWNLADFVQISWNPPDFERPIAKNGKPYVFGICHSSKCFKVTVTIEWTYIKLCLKEDISFKKPF